MSILLQGSNMVFPCFHICRIQRKVLKTWAWRVRMRDSANVKVWKTMFDLYYYMKTFFCNRKHQKKEKKMRLMGPFFHSEKSASLKCCFNGRAIESLCNLIIFDLPIHTDGDVVRTSRWPRLYFRWKSRFPTAHETLNNPVCLNIATWPSTSRICLSYLWLKQGSNSVARD